VHEEQHDQKRLARRNLRAIARLSKQAGAIVLLVQVVELVRYDRATFYHDISSSTATGYKLHRIVSCVALQLAACS
jgi:hypothetical protein